MAEWFGTQSAQDGNVEYAINHLCTIWNRWHLNGLCAGTRAQRDYLREHPPEPPFYPTSHYEKACKILKAADLYVDRGYKYGSAWLVEPLPEDVERLVVRICRAFGAT